MVGVRSLLRRARVLGDVAEVESNAGEGRGAAAHGVDEDVVDGQQGGGFRVIRFPAFEAGEGFGLIGRDGDGNEGHFGAGGFGTRGCDAGGLGSGFAEVGRPGGIAQSGGVVFVGESEQSLE